MYEKGDGVEPFENHWFSPSVQRSFRDKFAVVWVLGRFVAMGDPL
jgi:hypothetical protein